MATSMLVKDAVDVLDGSFNKHDDDFDLFASARSLAVPKEEQEPSAAPDLVVEEQKQQFVSPKDFELLKVIGMGSFGKVLQVRNRKSKKILAMKVISKRLLKRKGNYVENVQAERDILTKVRHPFVVTMHCSFQTKEKLFLVMDFLAGGELFLKMGREGIFREATAAFYLAEIVLALEHLHLQGILHRDLKPENILLGSDGHTCLTDFGLAKDMGNSTTMEEEEDYARTICGTQEYMAPEMVARKGYGRAADFWSLGCIAYEMLAGKPPFLSKKGSKDLFRKIMQERVRMPDGSSASACKLLKGLLNRNAQARLGAARSNMFEVGGVAGLKSCDFFTGLDWELLMEKEIDPPMTLDVDNDEDLRHFHDEFTQMPLPRSVTEMNKEHFEPKRVNSETFRGFSFIQDDFDLPERRDNEIERYWNSIDEDGESASECASSKFDLAEAAAPQSIDPPKKKRPPRKRKKKKNAGVAITPTPSENGDVISEKGEPLKTDGKAQSNGKNKQEEETKEAPDDSFKVQPKEPDGGAQVQPKEKAPVKNSQNKPNTQQPPLPPRLPGVGTSKGPPPSKPQPKETDAWEQVGKPKKSPKSVSRPIPQTRPNMTKQQQSKVNAAPHRPANTSTWTPNKSSTWGQQQPQAPATRRPSSDWRNHAMSPRSPKKTVMKAVVPPSDQLWPSLSDFPPPNGSGTTTATTNHPTLGAWGEKKSSSQPKGAWNR